MVATNCDFTVILKGRDPEQLNSVTVTTYHGSLERARPASQGRLRGSLGAGVPTAHLPACLGMRNANLPQERLLLSPSS